MVADGEPPVLICLLGGFRVLRRGAPVTVRPGGKTEALLSALALQEGCSASRGWLLEAIWPQSDENKASDALSTLVHATRRLFAGALGDAPPIVRAAGRYQLNVDAGVAVDTVTFGSLVRCADERARAGDGDGAARLLLRAVDLYHGDVCAVDGLRALMERERLRALHLTALGQLADHHYRARDYPAALGFAERLLGHDPCREDAHRLVMRCHVRLGARAQALRQYKTCVEILYTEFGAGPEPSTSDLFEQVCRSPGSV